MSSDVYLLETEIFDTGLLELPEVPDEQKWTIAATGNLRIEPDQFEVLKSGDFPYNEIHRILEADIVISNLELPVINNDELIAKVKSTIPEKVQASLHHIPSAILVDIQKMGINFFNLANDHIMDFGPDGVMETIRHLDDYAIPWCGAGENRAVAAAFTTVDIGGFNIAIGGYAQNETISAGVASPGANVIQPTRMLREVAALKNDPEMDFIVVAIHDGYKYSSVPRLEIFDLCHQLIDAGADLIIGNHPHMPHGLELYNEKLIIYSLGNFYYNIPKEQAEPFAHWTERSFVPKLTFKGNKLASIELTPTLIDENLLVNRATGNDRQEILELLRYRSDLLNPTDIDLENHDFVKAHVFDRMMNQIYDAGRRNDTEFLDYFLGKQIKKDSCLKCFKDIARLIGGRSSGV